MNVTTEALDWIRKAERDLVAARQLAESEQPLPDQTGFFVSRPPKSISRLSLSLLVRSRHASMI